MILREAAAGNEIVHIFEGAEEAIPPGDVAVVEGVNVELMVDGVMFGALDKVAHPVRCPEIAVVDVFSEHGEDVEPGALSFGGDAKQKKRTALAISESIAISTGCL